MKSFPYATTLSKHTVIGYLNSNERKVPLSKYRHVVASVTLRRLIVDRDDVGLADQCRVYARCVRADSFRGGLGASLQ
ncbi:hypothetical protein D3C71_1886980 [compost metagenome]